MPIVPSPGRRLAERATDAGNRWPVAEKTAKKPGGVAMARWLIGVFLVLHGVTHAF